MGLKSRQYEIIYRGIFASPFDYDMNMHKVRIAKLKELDGKPIDEEEQKAVERLKRLEDLGGIDKRFLSKEYSYQVK